MNRILKWIEEHRLESTAIVVILALATYFSLTLTTNAAVDSLNEALAELQDQVQERQELAERALRGAVLDAYPEMLQRERAYNMRLRNGEDALTEEDRQHAQALEETIAHYRPTMQAALRSGVRHHAMRRHMADLILSDPYVPGEMQQMAATPGDRPDQI